MPEMIDRILADDVIFFGLLTFIVLLSVILVQRHEITRLRALKEPRHGRR